MSKKILACVDDDPQIIENYKEIFEDLGYEVKTGSNGFDLGCIINEDDPAVLIVDLSMPGLNGLVALKRLTIGHKKLIAHTVVVSGIIDTDVEGELRKLQVKYFKKPVDYGLLVDTVKRLSTAPAAAS